jgi:hypothetical protein
MAPSDCLWTSVAAVEGRTVISGLYSDLEGFFTKTLGVESLDASMAYNELLEMTDKGATIQEVKQMLLAFDSLLISEANNPSTEDLSPRDLLKQRILPVIRPDGKKYLYKHSVEFAINDREDYYNAFKNNVKFLDFSLEEVCHLRRFISWAGLEDRYLSKVVREESRIEDGVVTPISSTMRNVKNKAYGLLRYVLLLALFEAVSLHHQRWTYVHT